MNLMLIIVLPLGLAFIFIVIVCVKFGSNRNSRPNKVYDEVSVFKYLKRIEWMKLIFPLFPADRNFHSSQLGGDSQIRCYPSR